MKLFKSKLIVFLPFIVLAVVLIFGLTIFPSINPTPKNLPIALVNEDEGVDVPNQGKMNMGNTIAEMIKKTTKHASGDKPAVKWVYVDSYEKAEKGLNNRDYYAALVIPKDFSQKQLSLRTPNPTSPEIQIVVNQGANAMAATMAGQMLNGVVVNINSNVRTQLFEGFEKQGISLSPKQAAALVSPISQKVTNVNEIGTHSVNGNAPISLFQPLWMASIAGAAIIFFMMSKLEFMNRTEKFITQLLQILMGAILALVAGFGLTWIADTLGLNIPQFSDTALFLSIAYFCFFLMISAVLSWLGIKGIGLFVLMLFFGAPLLAMPQEFMSAFYRDWINSWLPMRFLVEGLRELFFFGKELSWSGPTSTLVWIGVGSLIVLVASIVKPVSKKAVRNTVENVHQ